MSTSKLQEYTASKLFNAIPHLKIKENYRPYWLNGNGTGRLELDLYIPELRIAIEVQGAQHYIYVPYFHGSYDGFLDQKKRDEVKKSVCQIEGIELIEVSDYDEARQAVRVILDRINQGKEINYDLKQMRDNFLAKKEKIIRSRFKGHIEKLTDEISRLEDRIKSLSMIPSKGLTRDIDKRIEFLTFILTELHGVDEMLPYRKWLKQRRGEMRQKRNDILSNYKGLSHERSVLGEKKAKLKAAYTELNDQIDSLAVKWVKFYERNIDNI